MKRREKNSHIYFYGIRRVRPKKKKKEEKGIHNCLYINFIIKSLQMKSQIYKLRNVILFLTQMVGAFARTFRRWFFFFSARKANRVYEWEEHLANAPQNVVGI